MSSPIAVTVEPSDRSSNAEDQDVVSSSRSVYLFEVVNDHFDEFDWASQRRRPCGMTKCPLDAHLTAAAQTEQTPMTECAVCATTVPTSGMQSCHQCEKAICVICLIRMMVRGDEQSSAFCGFCRSPPKPPIVAYLRLITVSHRKELPFVRLTHERTLENMAQMLADVRPNPNNEMYATLSTTNNENTSDVASASSSAINTSTMRAQIDSAVAFAVTDKCSCGVRHQQRRRNRPDEASWTPLSTVESTSAHFTVQPASHSHASSISVEPSDNNAA